jgi:hypothetical protein
VRSDRFDQFIRRIATRGARQTATALPCTSDFCPEGGIADPRITTIVTATEGCLAGDVVCAGDDECCSGVCTMRGTCACFDADHICPNDGYCCSGSCVHHRCV